MGSMGRIQVYHLQLPQRMKLSGVVIDQPTITTTLGALGLPVMAPPFVPARFRQLLLRSKNELQLS